MSVDLRHEQFNAVLMHLTELFWQNQQDPAAVVQPDRGRYSIKMIIKPGFGADAIWIREDLGDYLAQPIDAAAVAARIYARYVDQRRADEGAKS